MLSRHAIRPGGVCPGTKKPPKGMGGLRGGNCLVALVDNDGGCSHYRPEVAHVSSVAGPSTIWLPGLRLWSPGWSGSRPGTGLDEGFEKPVIPASLRVPLHRQPES